MEYTRTNPKNNGQYRQLDGVGVIRLLHIKAARGSEQIVCNLVHTSLIDQPIYEALSYTWGSVENPEKICCDGYEVSVTRNLYAAMRRFRLKDEPRILWIDALCINQSDDKEKSEQIQMMTDIYRNARRGLIWLGEESESDQIAFQTLNSLNDFLNSHARELKQHGRTLSPGSQVLQDKIKDLNISPDAWRSLNEFFRRSWFRRVWVIQEAVSVPNFPEIPTLIAYGEFNVTWEVLVNVAQGIVNFGLFFLFGSGHIQGLGHSAIRSMEGMRRTSGTATPLECLEVLNSTRESLATDPRDKIFALNGLLRKEEANSPLLLPDYTKDAGKVYTDAAIYFLHGYRPLRLLQSIPWTLPQHGGIGGVSGLPSWVPDWSKRHAVPQLQSRMFQAGGMTSPELRICDNHNVLVIRGKVLDHIKVLMDPDRILQSMTSTDADSEIEERFRHKIEWYQCCVSIASTLGNHSTKGRFPLPSNLDEYPTGENLQEAFWRTLICNLNMQRVRATSEYGKCWLSSHKVFSQLEKGMAGIKSPQLILDMMKFEEPMDLFAGGRRFCTTANGYMGWVPQKSQYGDLLCIFKGGDIPFLLRRTVFRSGNLPFLIRPGAQYFEIIGECYIHGLMEGEAIEQDDNQWIDVMLR